MLSDLTGNRFGKWIVKSKGASQFCLCRCDCRFEKAVYRYDLLGGTSRQCVTCHKIKHRHTVGCRQSPTYTSWMCMIRRCEDPSVNDFERYGGSGITVCQRWHTFTFFLEDMGERPLHHVLDRIDGSRGYEPSNCRWLTPKESANNRANNRSVICDGKKVKLTEGAVLINRKYSALFSRMRFLGWPPIDIRTLSFRRSPTKRP